MTRGLVNGGRCAGVGRLNPRLTPPNERSKVVYSPAGLMMIDGRCKLHAASLTQGAAVDKSGGN